MTTAEYIRNHPLREFKKGQVILQGNDASEFLYAVRSGYVKIISYNNSGDARFLWVTGRYDVIPSEYLFLPTKPLDYFYIALTDVSAYEIKKTEFIAETKTNAALMKDTAIAMSTHYDDLLMRIGTMEESSVRMRLLSTLCQLAERFSTSDPVDFYELGLVLTHQDLADMTNSTRETATIELQKLRDEGYIDYSRNKLTVHLLACRNALEI